MFICVTGFCSVQPSTYTTICCCVKDNIISTKFVRILMYHNQGCYSLQDVFKTSCHNILKAFSRRFQDVLLKRLQDIFKRSSRRFQDVFKTSRKYVWKTSSRRFEDVSLSSTVFVNKSLRSIQHVCKTYCKDHCLQKDSPRSHF